MRQVRRHRIEAGRRHGIEAGRRHGIEAGRRHCIEGGKRHCIVSVKRPDCRTLVGVDSISTTHCDGHVLVSVTRDPWPPEADGGVRVVATAAH